MPAKSPSNSAATLLAATALTVCGSAWAQTADPDMSTAATQRPKIGREAQTSGVVAGSIVQSVTGQPIGRVQDLVPNANTGDPAYVVISTRAGTAAVPYAVVAPMFQNGHVVLNRARLESAPRVSASQLQDKNDVTWKARADRYWNDRNPADL